ncbi:MAG: endo-1,4-beta-xylanase [Fimbriiglobus sp.]
MGSVLLKVPESLPLSAQACLSMAALAGGYDVSPAPTQHHLQDNILTLTKEANESGYLAMPWPGPQGHPEVCLSATLRERSEPYHLLIELARGKLNQLRCQTHDWQAMGLVVDDLGLMESQEITRLFGKAVRDPDEPESSLLAIQALERAHRAGERLSASFAEQLLETRLGDGGPMETRLTITLTKLPAPEVRDEIAHIFTSVKLIPNWSVLEPKESEYAWEEFDALVTWAFQAGLDVSIGPVIDLTAKRFPAWIQGWTGKLIHLVTFLDDFVSKIVNRYKDRVRSWQICAGFNYQDALSLGEDERLNLAAKLYDTARNLDPDCSWSLGIAQPWGDYLRYEDHTYSPLVFTDNLIRNGFQFHSLELEAMSRERTPSMGFHDSISLYRLTELFGLLSIPLDVSFSDTADADAEPINFSIPAALSLSLPQIRSVICDFPLPNGERDGTGIHPDIRLTLRELRARYLA